MDKLAVVHSASTFCCTMDTGVIFCKKNENEN